MTANDLVNLWALQYAFKRVATYGPILADDIGAGHLVRCEETQAQLEWYEGFGGSDVTPGESPELLILVGCPHYQSLSMGLGDQNTAELIRNIVKWCLEHEND